MQYVGRFTAASGYWRRATAPQLGYGGSMTLRASILFIALELTLASACSDSAATVDAPTAIDAPVVAAKVVTCPAAPMFKVGVTGQSYVPAMQTVPAGSIVEIKASIDHSAKSLENLFLVDFGTTACVQFNTPGLYKFFCTAHGFVGSVTVQ
jgi:plastocyanin